MLSFRSSNFKVQNFHGFHFSSIKTFIFFFVSIKKSKKNSSAFSLSLPACIHLQVTSSITGPIIVEDVIYETDNGDISRILPSRDLTFRRLVFQRSEGLVQSEALLSEEGSKYKIGGESEKKKTHSSSKSKRRGNQRRSDGKLCLYCCKLNLNSFYSCYFCLSHEVCAHYLLHC